MSVSADGVYNYRRWDEEPERWSYLGPFADNQERLTQQALNVMHMSGEEIQQSVQTSIPQVQVFRPRFGYPEYAERQVGVQDIVGVGRNILHPASTWYSGGPAGYNGSPRYASNTLGLL